MKFYSLKTLGIEPILQELDTSVNQPTLRDFERCKLRHDILRLKDEGLDKDQLHAAICEIHEERWHDVYWSVRLFAPGSTQASEEHQLAVVQHMIATYPRYLAPLGVVRLYPSVLKAIREHLPDFQHVELKG